MQEEPRRRRRPALSCIECRRRKIKCDRHHPCQHCVAAKAQCNFRIYSDSAVQRALPSDPSARTSSSPIRSQQSDRIQPAIADANYPTTCHASASTASGQDTVSHASRHINTPTSNNASGVEPNIRDILSRVQKLEESSVSGSSRVQPPNSRDNSVIVAQPASQDSRLVLNKTRLGKWSHAMGVAKEYSPLYDSYSAAMGETQETRFHTGELGILVTQMGDLLRKCKAIARAVKKTRPSRSLSAPAFDLSPPPRDLSDRMATLYFESFESTYRILHIPSFWSNYAKFWDDAGDDATVVRLTILLVIGIGSAMHSGECTENVVRNQTPHWIYAAQTWLSGPLEKDRLSVPGIQLHCLTILARQIFSVGGDLVWSSTGSLIHRAMQIGLHHDPNHFPEITPFLAEIRRRLWATILEMVVQSSLDTAMPPRISYEEFDTRPPANIHDEEMDDPATALSNRSALDYTATSIQLILLESLPTRLRVLQLLNNFRQELSYSDVLELSAEISNFLRARNAAANEAQRSGMSVFHRNLLDYFVRRFMIPLHCAFASRAGSNPLFYSSLKICVDTGMTIISPEPDERFSRLMAVGGGMFREGLRYGATAISFDLLSQTEAQRLDGTLHPNSLHREALKKAMREVVSLAEKRIRQGDTNVKSHMFPNMILAQVEAIEAGTPYEMKMIQCAIDSLEFCLDLLQAKTGIASSASSNTGHPTPTDLYGGPCANFDWGLDFFFPDEVYS